VASWKKWAGGIVKTGPLFLFLLVRSRRKLEYDIKTHPPFAQVAAFARCAAFVSAMDKNPDSLFARIGGGSAKRTGCGWQAPIGIGQPLQNAGTLVRAGARH